MPDQGLKKLPQFTAIAKVHCHAVTWHAYGDSRSPWYDHSMITAWRHGRSSHHGMAVMEDSMTMAIIIT